MVLYKNVDIFDLKSIMEKGILSMDACGNDNWLDGKRSKSDTSVVYLFAPRKEQNSFPEYGTALLEVDCSATENEMTEQDVHKEDYIEYITKQVLPSEIKRVIIPNIFKSYVEIPENIDIYWCSMEAEHYGNNGLEKCDRKLLKKFAKTAPLMSTEDFNFFRGVNEDRTMIDLYNIKYILD